MLGFFPRLYPDELLYSWLARYHVYSMNSGSKRTMIELFDNPHQIAVPDLPVNLDCLQKKVAHFFQFKTDELISNHTFFRYYTAFAAPEIRDQTLSHMHYDARGGAIHMSTGVMASTFKEKEYFHYCSVCAEEDLRTYGEFYWHLSHQLPGVLVCTKHHFLLSKSLTPFRSVSRHQYITASRENCPTINSMIGNEYNPKTMEHLLGIAFEAEQLIHQGLTFDRDVLKHTYLNHLQKMGLARGKNYVYQRKLAEQFMAFYGVECLQLLQSDIPMEGESSWLKAITRKQRGAFHPIRHLLLIRFLGESLNSIDSKKDTPYHPFGQAPFPCLNKAADHFREPVIREIKITRCSSTGKPVGTFTCACGFQYSRKGPDLTKEDRFRIGRILAFGPVWRRRIEELIHIQKLTFRAAARTLGVDTHTVIKYSKKPNPSVNLEPSKPAYSGQFVEIKQQMWNDLRILHPNAGITQLRKADCALYSWLYRNCREWLTENSPEHLGVKQSQARIDWVERDLRLAKQAQMASQQLRQINPPVRITTSIIAGRIRMKSLIEKHLDKLPATERVLAQQNESREAFHIRRVHWAARKIREAGQEPVEWLVVRVAAIRLPISPVVRQEIKNIMVDPALTKRSGG